MDSASPPLLHPALLKTPRKALFQKQRGLTSKHSQTLGEPSGYDKSDMMSTKVRIQFEHDLEINLKSFEKEVHLQRLEQLRHLAEKLKDDAWIYPDLEATLGI